MKNTEEIENTEYEPLTETEEAIMDYMEMANLTDDEIELEMSVLDGTNNLDRMLEALEEAEMEGEEIDHPLIMHLIRELVYPKRQ